MIRPARPADASAIAALQSHLDAPSPELLASFAAVGACLVAVERPGGEPVGYAITVGEGDVHLAELVVDPDHRRRGHGRTLVDGVVARCDPGTRVTLLVAVDNDPARSLYESIGFQPVAYRPCFYERGGAWADALVYAYDVPG